MDIQQKEMSSKMESYRTFNNSKYRKGLWFIGNTVRGGESEEDWSEESEDHPKRLSVFIRTLNEDVLKDGM